ncbi:MAG: aspartate/glutamate racemase family protein [Ruminococcaceae bacterium]|nr:aspartate/glutamate racemase family protein [Oscillospiraceae bacterium]
MTLGVIGGLGPAATTYFMDMITNMTDASCDQEHLEMLVYSVPSVPDRTAFILGKSTDSPLPKMTEAGRVLSNMGAGIIAIPCMTAHAFHDELQTRITAPILDGIKLTALAIKESGAKKVGIMATSGTVKTGLFQKSLESEGLDFVLPSEECQSLVMSLIYDEIKTNSPVDIKKFEKVTAELFDGGAEVIILGCTELSLIKRDFDIGRGFADAMEILAWNSISLCGKIPRIPFSQLISLK